MSVPTAPDSRAFASWLAAQDDTALAALFHTRRVPTSSAWNDFFDVAEDLHDPAAITRALTALPRREADALSDAVAASSAHDGAPAVIAAGPERDRLVAAGLATPDGAVYRLVADAVRERPQTAPVPPTARDGERPEVAAERAFASSAALADILQLTLHTPLSRIGTGALGAADRRRLVEAGAAASSDDADDLVSLAATAGLAASGDRAWLVTRAGAQWLRAGTLERWTNVARRLRAALPDGLRSSAGGWIDVAEWAYAYPFDPAWPPQAEMWRRRLWHWAMIGADGAATPWASGLRAGADDAQVDRDVESLQALLPPEVDRVYLQNDLTAISPGPLAPQLDMRLRTMTLRESRAQASTYRFTADTIGAAITAGETAESLREFLETLSLTGVPQPLAYEIERTSARHGLVQLQWDDEAGRTRLTSSAPAILDTIAVDQALRPLGLIRDGDALVSRTAAETTFWMLADARYPVAALDANGTPRAVDRSRLAPPETPETSPSAQYAPLLARLRAAHDTDAESAWLERELDQAVRNRAVLAVVVRLPDGSTREFTLEASGIGGGRLRGRDRAADIERTLPVSSIESIRPLP